jgi:hypothetical protein
MTEHLDDAAMFALATGEEVAPARAAHLRACEACQERLSRTREVVGRLARLPAAASSPPTLWPRIAERMEAGARVPRPVSALPDGHGAVPERGSGGTRALRWLARAAAAAILFLGGMAAQAARDGGSPAADRPAPASAQTPRGPLTPAGAGSSAVAPAAEIQRAGTAYVTAIARLAEHAPSLSADDIEVARQVAYATIFGATHELSALGGADQAAQDIHGRALTAWLRGAAAEGG